LLLQFVTLLLLLLLLLLLQPFLRLTSSFRWLRLRAPTRRPFFILTAITVTITAAVCVTVTAAVCVTVTADMRCSIAVASTAAVANSRMLGRARAGAGAARCLISPQSLTMPQKVSELGHLQPPVCIKTFNPNTEREHPMASHP
jgi:hypothetical protein